MFLPTSNRGDWDDLLPPKTLAPWADAIRAAWEPELGRRDTSDLLLMAISASRAPKTYEGYKRQGHRRSKTVVSPPQPLAINFWPDYRYREPQRADEGRCG